MMNRQKIITKLRRELRNEHHLVGVSTGSGMIAKLVSEGGADFLIASNSGRFRFMGRSSLAGYLPFEDSNTAVFEFASREILPLIDEIPVLFGLNATDPQIETTNFLNKIKEAGFSGVNNYPSVGLIDGQYSEALAEAGISYEQEVEAIAKASKLNFFTVAYVFNLEQGLAMTRSGADIICYHCGLTKGGELGAKKVISLQMIITIAEEIFSECKKIRGDIICMIYGGPVNNPVDSQFLINKITDLDGFVGGSTFDRLTPSDIVIDKTKQFKDSELNTENDMMSQMLDGIEKHYDYVSFVLEYIKEQYPNEILLDELAKVAHVSASYLSTLFKKQVGSSFTEYLIKYRLNKAIEIIKKNPSLQLKKVAEMVGYVDYSQFNKIFKQYLGVSPSVYKNQIIQYKH